MNVNWKKIRPKVCENDCWVIFVIENSIKLQNNYVFFTTWLYYQGLAFFDQGHATC
jgi:hypothetical protein